MTSIKFLNMIALVGFLFIYMTPTTTFGEETYLILNGRPSLKIEGHPDGPLEEKLSDAKSHEYRVIISKVGDKYFWTTRDRRELVLSLSGVYLIFISLEGSGYIKVSLLDNTYMEHIHLGMSNITYWGKVEDLDIK